MWKFDDWKLIKKMKYLLMSTSPNITTGYGILSNSLMKNFLKQKVDIKMLGLQTIGIQEKEWLLPVLNDVFGSDALQEYIQHYEIDALITILDNWVQSYAYIPPLLKKLKCKHIAHVTANSAPLGSQLIDKLKDADYYIAPSKYVEDLLLEVFPKNKVRYIPHGFDSKIFKSFSPEEKKKCKEEIGYENKFVFLSIGTNKGIQKNWPGLFYAYKIFLINNPKAKKDTLLHCHTDMHSADGYDLELLAKRYGIAENVSYVDVKLNSGTPPEKIVRLYNLADCFVSASMGESFGLPLLESMACGVPVIFPNHSTGPQLVGEPKTGLLADLMKMKGGQDFGLTSPLVSDKFWADPVCMAECMEKIYKDKKLREQFSKNAINFAKEFDYEKKVIPMWIDFFKELEEIKEPIDYKENKIGI